MIGPAPTRAEVRERLLDLLSSRCTREEVADWAASWIREATPDVSDAVVWSALKELSGADLKSGPDEYLHEESDFHQWLDRLETQ